MAARLHEMTMSQPATCWQDALPTGNGSVGAMMYGQICSEQILLNHEALWYHGARPEMVVLSDLLPKLRDMIEQGRYEEAQNLLSEYNQVRGGVWCPTDPYQPTCDIRLSASTNGPFRHYRRGINFLNGLTWVRWEDDLCQFHRELFVSRVDNVVLLRIRANQSGQVSCRLRLEAHDGGQNRSAGGFSAPTSPPPTKFEQGVDGEWLSFSGTFDTGQQFGALGQVITTGDQLQKLEGENELTIQNADEILLRVKVFANESPDIALPRLRRELGSLSADFDELLLRHTEAQGELFERMSLHLTHGTKASNEEMLLQAYDGDVPTALVQRMFDFGRHLLICSSRENGWPANLQGVWNGDYSPAWSSDFHNDENIQMNYWQALPGNLAELTLAFFDYYEGFMDDYRENARKIYGCRGILAPIAQATNGKMYPGPWVNWTAGAGWLGQLFYDYFLFTGDLEFLAKRAVPWLKEVALFYEDFLFEGADGNLVFSPSLSPENKPLLPNASLVAINATMDVAICREVLENLCDACKGLNIEADGIVRWRGILEKLPKYDVNEDGAIREWLHPRFPDNYHHRHQSHIYPLFPGISITEENAPQLFKACQRAVEKRLVIGLNSQSGWSMAHMANIYARLGDGNRALECIEILTRSSTGSNLLTYHNDWRNMGLSLSGWGAVPPFQIDANFGVTAAVLEMLAFSKLGLLKLLPALPDKWTIGQARGIACRGRIVVDLDWNMEKGILSAILVSQTTQELIIKFPRIPKEIHCDVKGVDIQPAETGETYRALRLLCEQSITLSVAF